ncbi:hypothetical protein [Parvularcula lutaonensis]|uniref:XapX domain-containing protein n=1 Tax=Parvularcula lutaonensis TaxID=491923 RepID=A0ABV7MDW1_9PROT|nr:hypothetical protein [Parvularcula lutaonensis]GGY50263.1 hypothetical protein GCM10007148_18810 [Parvularcula lutaonensis]
MSLFRIILYAMALGVVTRFLFVDIGEMVGRELPAGLIGMAVALVSVVLAGRIQPLPKKPRRKD